MSTKVTKELKEWGIFAAIVGILYFTGLHTEVAGFIQRMVLYTGIVQPSMQADSDINADYNLLLQNLSTGENVNLKTSEGRVIFMNYWATWCTPCIAEMPNIQALYTEMEEKNIDFYLITVDKDIEKAKKFIKRKGYTFPVYTMKSARPGIYSSGSIPTTFVIDRKGKIVTTHKGMANYDTDSFKSFLNELTQ